MLQTITKRNLNISVFPNVVDAICILSVFFFFLHLKEYREKKKEGKNIQLTGSKCVEFQMNILINKYLLNFMSHKQTHTIIIFL